MSKIINTTAVAGFTAVIIIGLPMLAFISACVVLSK